MIRYDSSLGVAFCIAYVEKAYTAWHWGVRSLVGGCEIGFKAGICWGCMGAVCCRCLSVGSHSCERSALSRPHSRQIMCGQGCEMSHIHGNPCLAWGQASILQQAGLRAV